VQYSLQGKSLKGWGGGGEFPYCCALCDKRYIKYTNYDNHINSYDHAHRQVVFPTVTCAVWTLVLYFLRLSAICNANVVAPKATI